MKKYTKMHVLFYETATTLSIDLTTKKVDNWFFKESMETNSKTADMCCLKFEQQGSKELLSYMGYVPDFFPGEHWGDYVRLEISEKGVVKKLKVTDAQIDKLLAGYDDEEDEDSISD